MEEAEWVDEMRMHEMSGDDALGEEESVKRPPPKSGKALRC